jgi:hypothetical protein
MVLMLTYTTPSSTRSWDMARYDRQEEENLLDHLYIALDFMQSLLRRSPNWRTQRS